MIWIGDVEVTDVTPAERAHARREDRARSRPTKEGNGQMPLSSAQIDVINRDSYWRHFGPVLIPAGSAPTSADQTPINQMLLGFDSKVNQM